MHKFVKMLVVPALVLAAACGRNDKPMDDALQERPVARVLDAAVSTAAVRVADGAGLLRATGTGSTRSSLTGTTRARRSRSRSAGSTARRRARSSGTYSTGTAPGPVRGS